MLASPGWSRAVLIACVATVALPVTAQAASMQKAQIIDAYGFAQPEVAATVDIPAGWRTLGGMVWNHGTNCVTNKVRFDWRARSRDDMHGFEVMPGYNWQVQGTQIQMNPCPAQPFRSVREFLEAVVQQRRAGARVLQYRDRPDLAATQQAQAKSDPRVQLRFEAGQLLIGYTSGGVEFREVVGTTATFSKVQGNVMGQVNMVFAHRAPNGQLDFDLGERMAQSIRYEARWGEQMVASLKASEQRFSTDQRRKIDEWHAREMARINAEGAADRAAIRAATSREIARIGSETHASTQATNDRIHRRTLEGVGEYNTYQGDGGSTVRSSIHGGQRVLSNGNGTYFSTNDPYFNPTGSRELRRIP
jgi:hypothetical protein